jgi:hypothetical protein
VPCLVPSLPEPDNTRMAPEPVITRNHYYSNTVIFTVFHDRR